MSTNDALSVARDYHESWTTGDHARTRSLLASDLRVEVPINEYASADAFAEAVRGFGSMVDRTELLSELGAGDEAMLLYDMEVAGLGTMRIAEHFTVADGRIVRVRQIHDTVALRDAGFAAPPPAEDHHSEVLIEAPAATVCAALATAEGIRGWWSTDVAAQPGGRIRLNWSAADHLVLRVDRVEAPHAVDWSVVEQHDRNLPRPDEWVGTRMSFRLSEDDGATRLSLTHHGLAPLDCGEICAAGWESFLRHSLKPFAETGRGRPRRPDPAVAP